MVEGVSAPARPVRGRVPGEGIETGGGAALVALVGPPNAGKTTLYNQLTGLRQKVANYPGVTVEKHVGRARLADDREVDLVDLPGVNGFSARTLDERVTRDVLEGRVAGLRAPDAVVLVVDSTRLESQLMLAEPVLELDLPTLLVLNMADELEARGGAVSDEELASSLGVEVVRTNARSGAGVDRVRAWLLAAADRGRGPARPAGTVSNVSKRTPLPVVDAFQARRKRVRAAVGSAEYRSPGPSRVERHAGQRPPAPCGRSAGVPGGGRAGFPGDLHLGDAVHGRHGVADRLIRGVAGAAAAGRAGSDRW